MVMIIYGLIWLLMGAVFGLLYLTGYFNELALAVGGFSFSTLFFMGIVAVLPWWVDKRHSWKY